MIFNFLKFIEDLRNNEEKKAVVEKYEKFFGPIIGDVKDQRRYPTYISKFKPISYDVPAELKDDFDRDLLLQFVAASFSSEWVLDNVDGKELPEFVISVVSGDQSVTKMVSELRGFQLLRLYEIYIEEQLNLDVLIAEDDEKHGSEEEKKPEKMAILSQRDARLHRRQLVLDNLDKDILTKEHNKEKEGKLDDLMGML